MAEAAAGEAPGEEAAVEELKEEEEGLDVTVVVAAEGLEGVVAADEKVEEPEPLGVAGPKAAEPGLKGAPDVAALKEHMGAVGPRVEKALRPDTTGAIKELPVEKVQLPDTTQEIKELPELKAPPLDIMRATKVPPELKALPRVTMREIKARLEQKVLPPVTMRATRGLAELKAPPLDTTREIKALRADTTLAEQRTVPLARITWAE